MSLEIIQFKNNTDEPINVDMLTVIFENGKSWLKGLEIEVLNSTKGHLYNRYLTELEIITDLRQVKHSVRSFCHSDCKSIQTDEFKIIQSKTSNNHVCSFDKKTLLNSVNFIINPKSNVKLQYNN